MEKVVLTKEVREKLAGLMPMTTEAKHKFTPKAYSESDVPEEYWPVYTVRQLNNDEAREVKRLVYAEALQMQSKKKKTAQSLVENSDIARDAYVELCKKCITDWVNVFDLNTGEQLKKTDENIEALPEGVLVDIFTEVVKITGIRL